jgi:hypothetical protein
VTPHPFLVSNRLFRGSYVSLEAALASYGLIPEAVPVVTAVGGGRPERLNTPLGAFEHRHVRPALVRGGRLQEVSPGQKAFVASPEKALLDVVYLNEGGDTPEFLRGLRLQHMERLDANALTEAEALFGTPKMSRAARTIRALAREQREEYREL